jgi:hypothetical protein
VKWPSAELGYYTTILWMLRQGDRLQYPLPTMKLQLTDLLQHVQPFTGLSYAGSNTFYEPLGRLIDAINKEARLSSILSTNPVIGDEQ